jgi:hypothetical protein
MLRNHDSEDQDPPEWFDNSVCRPSVVCNGETALKHASGVYSLAIKYDIDKDVAD